MQTYMLYRDGEEIEVGWLTKKLDEFHQFWNMCKVTDWVHYFQSNGPGHIVSKEFSGFRQMTNEPSIVGDWTILVKGGIRPLSGSYYYRRIVESEFDRCVVKNWSERVKNRMLQAETRLVLYAESGLQNRVSPPVSASLYYEELMRLEE